MSNENTTIQTPTAETTEAVKAVRSNPGKKAAIPTAEAEGQAKGPVSITKLPDGTIKEDF